MIELLVAMAIMAVLIGLATFGVGIMQRNSRNTLRRQSLSDLRLLISEMRLVNNQSITSIVTSDNATINTAPIALSAAYDPPDFSAVAVPSPCNNANMNVEETLTNTFTACLNNTNNVLRVRLEGTTTSYDISLYQ